jgi:hypothetical protein
MIHAMIDVEALRLHKPWIAPLLEIGIVLFTETGVVIGRKRILINQQSLPSWASPEPETVDFWEGQVYWAELQRDIFMSGQLASDAIKAFCDYLRVHEVGAFWFAGPQYDQVMLEAYLAEYKLPNPWSHQDARDFRTIRKQYDPLYRFACERRKNLHSAVDDCLFQVNVLRSIYNITLKPWG